MVRDDIGESHRLSPRSSSVARRRVVNTIAHTAAVDAASGEEKTAARSAIVSSRSTGAPLREFWHRRTIRAQLLIIVIAIDLAAALVAGTVTILRARSATQVEIAASMRLADVLAEEAVRLIPHDASPQQILDSLPLQLRFLRHVRIAVHGADDAVLPPSANGAERTPSEAATRAPSWFYGLIAPVAESHEYPIVAQGRPIGSVLIASEPGDEIAEVWSNTVALGLVALAVNAAMIGVLYLLFGRALAPLVGLSGALNELERTNYDVRLSRPRAFEFAALTDRLNALAETLRAARARNAALGRRIITAQDDERRRVALELHDEVGPSLFGLKANANSMAAALAAAPDAGSRRLADRARDMLGIIEHLQVINRSLLNRLRPMALGHVPLGDVLDQLVRDRAREHPQISFSLAADDVARGYGDAADLTVYRCIQESLTNTIRHAQAEHVTVTLREIHSSGAGARLTLTVEDDGTGMRPPFTLGFGLRGMQERVQGLGGELAIEATAPHGTRVQVTIPVEATAASTPASRDTVPA